MTSPQSVSAPWPTHASTGAAPSASIDAIRAAERELAMYAAIIGHHPTVEPHPPASEPAQDSPAVAAHDEAEPHPTILLHTFHLDSAELKHRVSDWVKQMSHQAKRRIDEAKMRLAG